MKKNCLFLALLATSFGLASCDFSFSSLFGKDKEEDKETKTTEVSLNDLKNVLTPIVSGLFEMEEEDVTYGNYNDEESTDYAFVYNESNLTFVGTFTYTEEGTPDDLIDELETLIPEEAEFQDEDSTEEDGLYDYWYLLDDKIYVELFCSEMYGDDCFIEFDVFAKNQKEAYIEFLESQEGGSGEIDDDLINELKPIMNSIILNLFEIDEKDITYADYNDETSQAYGYYSSSEALTFLSTIVYSEEGTPDSFIDYFEACVPTGATLVEEMSEVDTDYYDLWFEYGNYYVTLYADQYYGDDCFAQFDVFKASQAEEYRAQMYTEE